MRRTRLLLAILSALCLAAAARAQQPQPQVCALNVEQAPELRGFRLGMIVDQVKARVPGLKAQKVELGLSRAWFSDFRNLDPVAYKGVDGSYFEFLDDRLVQLSFDYDGSVHWKSLEQFAARVSELLKLPNAWQYAGSSKVLTCAGFNVQVSANPNIIRLTALGTDEILKRRREEHEEQLRRDFRP